MASLEEIAPTSKPRVIDLVAEAGLDVSDWPNFKKGRNEKRAASNPKYCYRWAFSEPGVAVVLNLWHPNCRIEDGAIVQTNNFRADAQKYNTSKASVWRTRALELDAAIQLALSSPLPIRVILLSGDMKIIGDEESKASSVHKRALDQEFWSVRSYDSATGEHVLVRGLVAPQFVDQFSVPFETEPPERRKVSGSAYVRDNKVRTWALQQANGSCRYCQSPGFKMANGSVYLETHHIVPLAEGGPDNVGNVIALCPNHHREAHYGEDQEGFRAKLKICISSSSQSGCAV